ENVGIGHAFSFLYRRLWPECQVPIVPVMLNTYYPPNQPTPKRCYQLGQAIRSAVGSWSGGKRVALMASGGLSHIVIDEPLDQQRLDPLRAQARYALRPAATPRDRAEPHHDGAQAKTPLRNGGQVSGSGRTACQEWSLCRRQPQVSSAKHPSCGGSPREGARSELASAA